MPHRLHLEIFGPVHGLPILHYRMEFAHLVRQAVESLKPDCIAIELPATLDAPFRRGIARLPQVSVLMYEIKTTGRQAAPETVCLLLEPADPVTEAGRMAVERGIPLHLIDVDLDDYPEHREPVPDSYAIHRVGLPAYYEQYAAATSSTVPEPEDLRREKGMAYRLQELSSRHERILFICGMAHLARIKELFAKPQAMPLEKTRRSNVRLCNLHPDSCREVLGEYPFLNALYDLRRNPLPPLPAVQAYSLRKRFNALELISGGKKEVPEEEVLREAVERSARLLGKEREMPDRQRIALRLFLESARHYRQETGEPVHLWQKRAFFRFSRNYALASGQLLPDLFQMLASARGCVDDNFAYALFRLATFYPWQKEASDVQTVRLSPEDFRAGTRRLRFRPRQQRPGKGLSHLQFLKRKREKKPGDWLKGFDDPSICSYPPEDIVIEQYGHFLKKKGAKQLSEEQSRVEPFSASLLDGIDMRETLRNLHEGRIYVRENQRVKGGVGAVVVIFDEDGGSSRYPYLMTWLGEHEQESDMAFYGTAPGDNIVGPGISRCEYGGLILSYPPRRMLDVWHDPDYSFARSKPEVLLLAALDYSREPHVVYAAAKPPRSYFRQIAARLGKKIVYIPLGSLSPVKLKQLRVFHVLYGKDKREIAKDYVW
ncbi:hypothetical protein [Geobacter sp. DSM 9736]|uniref:hypothetical protein n=1 Tax=Geobacter sp. DSM 9736 TaxID=1277350 RepID=UPI000B4FDE2F|nr:hypothetical protein [Geobacter sp. DSM 9736]SNB47250.1 hypothetical protein SAMN06269301_2728 [Geobacter sp. DSM 9736]